MKSACSINIKYAINGAGLVGARIQYDEKSKPFIRCAVRNVMSVHGCVSPQLGMYCWVDCVCKCAGDVHLRSRILHSLFVIIFVWVNKHSYAELGCNRNGHIVYRFHCHICFVIREVSIRLRLHRVMEIRIQFTLSVSIVGDPQCTTSHHCFVVWFYLCEISGC